MIDLKGNKRIALFAAISAVIVLAGIILYALLGFNTLPDAPQKYTIEVHYGVMVELTEGAEENLSAACEKAFSDNGISYISKEVTPHYDSNSLAETMDTFVVYTFAGGTSEAALAKAAAAINEAANGQTFADMEVQAAWHTLESGRFVEPAWRGAIAIAVAAIVALAYITVRYGVSCGVAGLVCAAHDALFTAALFAVTRMPVFGAAPLLYAALAAFLSILYWTAISIRMKENFKAAGAPSSEETIRGTVTESRKLIFLLAIVFAAVIVLAGAIGTWQVALFVLPMLVAVAVPLYSSLLLGQEVCVPIRKAFDKRKAQKKGGYVAKKRASAADSE